MAGDVEAERTTLARVDDAIVPRLQATARGTARGLGLPVRALRRLDGWVARGRVARSMFMRRRLVALLAVMVGLAGSAIHVQRYDEIQQRREDERAAQAEQTVRIAGGALPGFELPGDLTAHGPQRGTDPADWIADRRAALADLGPGVHAAVVSFDGFRNADDLAERLVDVTPLRAQYRLPDASEPPLETEVVAGDIAASVARVVDDALRTIREEESALQELIDSGTIEDPAFEADNRNRIEELRAIRNVLELTGDVVFAVVVEGDVDALRALQADDAVRLVDPLPEEADPGTVAVYGLLPDDRDEVGFGV